LALGQQQVTPLEVPPMVKKRKSHEKMDGENMGDEGERATKVAATSQGLEIKAMNLQHQRPPGSN
jgi:hypothetical protein